MYIYMGIYIPHERVLVVYIKLYNTLELQESTLRSLLR